MWLKAMPNSQPLVMLIRLLAIKLSMTDLLLSNGQQSIVVILLALIKARLEDSQLTPQNEAPIVKRGDLLVA